MARSILYCGSEDDFARLLEGLHSSTQARRLEGSSGEVRLRAGEHEVSITRCADPMDVLQVLRTRYVHLVLLDLRARPEQIAARAAQTFELLRALDEIEDIESRYGFHRIVGLLSMRRGAARDELLLELGAHGVVRVLDDPDEAQDRAPGAPFCRTLLRAMAEPSPRPGGERAICAAGGGITGIYFEMGALKCLEDCLGVGTLNEFDAFYGISAGAVVVSVLAQGYSMDEFMAAILGVEGGRMPPVDLRLFRLAHIDRTALRERVGRALGVAWRHLGQLLRPRGASLESLFFDVADLVTPPFHADGFEQTLRRCFSVPGTTNDFRQLRRKLYIGTTDHDAREHVVFGAPGHDETPISLAIQASISFSPAFTPTLMGGRYYEDGMVTRTSNVREAVRRGASLLFVLDPFVPYVSRRAGYANERGVLYNVDQDIRTFSYTRFEGTRNSLLRHHPRVSSYTFLPANRLRQLLSVSPMDHRPHLEIWRGAYLSTLQRVHRLAHRLRGDLAVRGLTLDMSRADAVAERLEATERPSFADFFPDGRVAIARPPQPPLPVARGHLDAPAPALADRATSVG